MDIPKDLLSKAFLSPFKSEEDVSKFLTNLHARVLLQMFEGEMDSHLGYQKYSIEGNNSGNSRNLFDQKWGSKYPYAIRSWRVNWDELTAFFDFPVEIRKIIYTTNLIENLNGKIRKYTKNKLSFPNDDALKKAVYLSITEIEKGWNQPIWNWDLIFNQFITIFENRIQV